MHWGKKGPRVTVLVEALEWSWANAEDLPVHELLRVERRVDDLHVHVARLLWGHLIWSLGGLILGLVFLGSPFILDVSHKTLLLRGQQALDCALPWRSHIGTKCSRERRHGAGFWGLLYLVTETPLDLGQFSLASSSRMELRWKFWVNKHCHLLPEPRTVLDHLVNVSKYLLNEWGKLHSHSLLEI